MFQRKVHSFQGLREIFPLSIEPSNANKFVEIQCILNYTINVYIQRNFLESNLVCICPHFFQDSSCKKLLSVVLMYFSNYCVISDKFMSQLAQFETWKHAYRLVLSFRARRKNMKLLCIACRMIVIFLNFN